MSTREPKHDGQYKAKGRRHGRGGSSKASPSQQHGRRHVTSGTQQSSYSHRGPSRSQGPQTNTEQQQPTRQAPQHQPEVTYAQKARAESMPVLPKTEPGPTQQKAPSPPASPATSSLPTTVSAPTTPPTSTPAPSFAAAAAAAVGMSPTTSASQQTAPALGSATAPAVTTASPTISSTTTPTPATSNGESNHPLRGPTSVTPQRPAAGVNFLPNGQGRTMVPPRVQSAPPNLKEQREQPRLFRPFKPPYGYPTAYYQQNPMGHPPYPHMQPTNSHVPAQPQQTQQQQTQQPQPQQQTQQPGQQQPPPQQAQASTSPQVQRGPHPQTFRPPAHGAAQIPHSMGMPGMAVPGVVPGVGVGVPPHLQHPVPQQMQRPPVAQPYGPYQHPAAVGGSHLSQPVAYQPRRVSRAIPIFNPSTGKQVIGRAATTAAAAPPAEREPPAASPVPPQGSKKLQIVSPAMKAAQQSSSTSNGAPESSTTPTSSQMAAKSDQGPETSDASPEEAETIPVSVTETGESEKPASEQVPAKEPFTPSTPTELAPSPSTASEPSATTPSSAEPVLLSTPSTHEITPASKSEVPSPTTEEGQSQETKEVSDLQRREIPKKSSGTYLTPAQRKAMQKGGADETPSTAAEPLTEEQKSSGQTEEKQAQPKTEEKQANKEPEQPVNNEKEEEKQQSESKGPAEQEVAPEESQEATEEEDEEDDWEAKAEKEDLSLEKPADISLRPNFGGSWTFSSSTKDDETGAGSAWSPSNPTGKKMYARDFLLQFQQLCRDKPPGLPSIEVILGDDRKSGGAPGGVSPRTKGGPQQQQWNRGPAGGTFSPRGGARGGAMVHPRFGGFQGGPGGRGMVMPPPGLRQPPGMPMRGHQRMPGGKGKMPGKGPELPLVPIPEPTEGVWRPSRRLKEADGSEVTIKKFRLALNKLTEEKFEPLSKEIVDVMKADVKTIGMLKKVIGTIFDKALAEPGFCTMYALLCRVLDRHCPQFEDQPKTAGGKPQNVFKRILLNKCQEEFELKPQDKEIKAKTPEEAELEEIKQKKRMIGNIVFIGELYKEHMLTDRIMHECIFRRLLGDIKNPVEGDIEALCKLMTTIGKVLDTAKAGSHMDAYFRRMKTLAQDKKLPSRLRFMLQDVIDLRANRWVSKKANDPKNPKATRATNPVGRPNKPAVVGPKASAAGVTAGPAGASSSARSASTEGWETVGSKKVADSAQDEPLVLGPNSRMGPITSVSKGAKGWQPDRKSSTGPAGRGRAAPEPVTKGNMFSALAGSASPGAEYVPTRRSSKREPSPKKTSVSPPPEKAAPPKEELEKEANMLLMEYFDTNDEAEAVQCVQELDSSYYPEFIRFAIVMSVDKKEDDRYLTQKLFGELRKNDVLSPAQFEEGFGLVLAELPDITVDAPLAPKIVGTFLATAILDECFDLSYLKTGLEELVPIGLAETVLASVLGHLSDETSASEAQDTWRAANLNLTDFFAPAKRGDSHIAQWVEKNNLGRLFPMRVTGTKVTNMLAEGASVDSIVAWLKRNLSDEIGTEELARSVMSVVLDHIANKTGVARGGVPAPETLTEEREFYLALSPVLKLVMPDDSAQLGGLFAVQQFCFDKDFPEGLASRAFSYLHETGVVYPDTFSNWAEDSSDETPGKREILQQVSEVLASLSSPPLEEEEGSGSAE